jgi:hypothetical protein
MNTVDVAALIKADYESSPIGYLPHGCIVHAGDNSTMNPDGSVKLANGTHVPAQHCEGKAVKTSSPTSSGWIEYGNGYKEPFTTPTVGYFSDK